MAGEMIRIKREDFDAGKLVCPKCRDRVDPKRTSVSLVQMTSWDPIGGGDRRTEDVLATLPCPTCDEAVRVSFIAEHDP